MSLQQLDASGALVGHEPPADTRQAIRRLLHGNAFDPERVAILDEAFRGTCDDLGVTETMTRARDIIAKRTVELADRQCRPEAIRAAVVVSLRYM